MQLLPQSYMEFISGEHNIDDEALELTGIEEAPHVHAVLSCLPPQAGFKEGRDLFSY